MSHSVISRYKFKILALVQFRDAKIHLQVDVGRGGGMTNK